jgi:hypothetical protein
LTIKSTFQKFTDDKTLTFDFLGDQVSKFKGDHQTLLSTIEERRDSAAGNYDAVFGQIRNFDWTFTPEGYYDITLSIISFGDVLESLKANVQNSDDTSSPDTEESTENKPIDISKAKTDKEIIDTLKNLDSIGNLAWKIKNLFEYLECYRELREHNNSKKYRWFRSSRCSRAGRLFKII